MLILSPGLDEENDDPPEKGCDGDDDAVFAVDDEKG